MARRPPGLRSVISLRNARGRSVGGEVHPDGADQDDIEGEAGGEGVLQRRKAVVAPVDAGVVVADPGELAHAGGGLDGDDVVA